MKVLTHCFANVFQAMSFQLVHFYLLAINEVGMGLTILFRCDTSRVLPTT